MNLIILCICAAERAKYEKQVELWNETHPDEQLVIGKNGTAVRSQADPEKKKKREDKAAAKFVCIPFCTVIMHTTVCRVECLVVAEISHEFPLIRFFCFRRTPSVIVGTRLHGWIHERLAFYLCWWMATATMTWGTCYTLDAPST